ncbi:MAG: hypothetical protein JO353_05500, partial [Phycisphaerae bacterium]|nr:hypothetical protein [Phycisphaerae bacterium]
MRTRLRLQDFYNPAMLSGRVIDSTQRLRGVSNLAYTMRALGRHDLPAALSLNGRIYRHVRTVKHDFFAATGFYDDSGGHRIVLKVGRINDFFGFPAMFLGRWSCRRETRFYSRLSDLHNVPRVLGRVGKTGFVHEFVKGRPLGERDAGGKIQPIPDSFFDELIALLRELHRRQIAYVDTNKPQNILQGDDGRPHLIDFQISYDLHELGDNWLNRSVLERFKREDFYHVLKHKRRLRPDLMTAEERQMAARKSWAIRLHRFVFAPYFKFRRRTFRRLRETG